MPRKDEYTALRNLISQAHKLLSSIEHPDPTVIRAREVLRSADALATDLARIPPAVAMGKAGGKKTAERGPEYFKQIAAMRKTKGGGRPRKEES